MSGNFLSCIRVSRTLSRLKGKVGCLLRSHIVKVPHLVLRVQSPSFSRVAAGKLGFLSSYNGEFWDPLMWPQESPVSMRVGRGLLRFLSNRSQVLGPYLELSPEPQVSSPVLT